MYGPEPAGHSLYLASAAEASIWQLQGILLQRYSQSPTMSVKTSVHIPAYDWQFNLVVYPIPSTSLRTVSIAYK